MARTGTAGRSNGPHLPTTEGVSAADKSVLCSTLKRLGAVAAAPNCGAIPWEDRDDEFLPWGTHPGGQRPRAYPIAELATRKTVAWRE